MSARINPPHPQAGPILFAVVCVVGIVIAIVRGLDYRIGTDPWWASVLLLAIVLVGFAFIEGGWLWIQREVTVADGRIVVRRWLGALRGQSGRAIPLEDGTRVSITLENLRSLRIERNGVTEAVLTLGYWEPSHVRNLIDALRANGVPFAQYWVGAYPPDLS